jgi:hypothetical protein
MSTDDWNNLRENTLNWGKDGIIEFSKFLKMTYDEQQQYLTDMQLSEQSALLDSTENTIA